MTIDERIQNLLENVRLLASFHRDTETALQKLSAHVDTIAQLVIIHEARLKRLEGDGQSPE